MPEAREPWSADVVRSAAVADDPLARSGLAGMLAGDPRIELVAEFSASPELGELLDAAAVELTVWDLGLDPRAHVERVAALVLDEKKVVALIPAEEHARVLLGAGVLGVLLRDVEPDRLRAALLAVSSGLVVLDEFIARSLATARPLPTVSLPDALTPRELEVLELLAEGLSNKLVAVRLGISEHTAKFHVNSILGKLGVQTRTEAVVRAARLGLVSL